MELLYYLQEFEPRLEDVCSCITKEMLRATWARPLDLSSVRYGTDFHIDSEEQETPAETLSRLTSPFVESALWAEDCGKQSAELEKLQEQVILNSKKVRDLQDKLREKDSDLLEMRTQGKKAQQKFEQEHKSQAAQLEQTLRQRTFELERAIADAHKQGEVSTRFLLEITNELLGSPELRKYRERFPSQFTATSEAIQDTLVLWASQFLPNTQAPALEAPEQLYLAVLRNVFPSAVPATPSRTKEERAGLVVDAMRRVFGSVGSPFDSATDVLTAAEDAHFVALAMLYWACCDRRIFGSPPSALTSLPSDALGEARKTWSEYKRWHQLGHDALFSVMRGVMHRTSDACCNFCGKPRRMPTSTPRDCITYADALRASGQAAEADLWYGNALQKIVPGSGGEEEFEALHKRATLRAGALGKPQEARADFSAACSLQPANPEIARNYADFLFKSLGALPDALEAYNSAIANGRNDAETTNLRGEVMKALEQDPSMVLAEFEQALELDPNYEPARKNRDAMLPVVLEMQKQKAQQALLEAMEKLPTVEFEKNKANLDTTDTQSLDAVVRILNEFPRVRLRVEGTTVNKAKIPLALSRAEACISYLVQKGIDKHRLEPFGSHGAKMATVFHPID
eukprot:TRINITY_DN6139_c0_g1_i1.p1 TRINITY_DN6139_c0_g1~~TRINITY_DN6139_c0_g1_i1.p1  ORF type:complete len:629 (+),score=119.94 TRINITY_DN6139_c0_g1_i1:787-2673(+)